MNIEKMEYIVAVAQERSFSKAAAKLHLTQPSLSQSVSSLEQSLGYRIFRRTTNSVSLTDEGAVFVETAERILAMCRECDAKVSDINELKSGNLTVGVPNFRGTVILPRILPRFMKEYPGVKISVVESSSNQLEMLTAKGKTDLTIINLPIKQSGIAYVPVCKERLLLAAPPDHPLCEKYGVTFPQDFSRLPIISFDDIRHAPFVVLRQEHRLRQSADRIFQYAGIAPDIKLEINNLLTAEQLVAAGIGFLIIGETAARFSNLTPCPAYFRMAVPIEWTLVVAHQENRYMSKIAMEFLRVTKEALRENR